jgi:hypothetical protein
MTSPEVLFLMGLRTSDQHPFFFDADHTKWIHDNDGNVVVLEQTGIFRKNTVHLFPEAIYGERGKGV